MPVAADEALHRQREHLREVGQHHFAAIALPVGIGREADRSVESEVRRNIGETLGVQRQPQLQALQRIDREQTRGIEEQHRQRVAAPAHVVGGLGAGEAIQTAFERSEPAHEDRQPALEHPGHVETERPGQREQHDDVEPCLEAGIGIHE